MKHEPIRVWLEKDVDEIEGHLLIVGDVMGDCAKCKEVGIDFSQAKECPHCHAPFRYITARNAAGAGDHRFHEARRIIGRRSDLIFVDYDDYKKLSGRSKAQKLFGP